MLGVHSKLFARFECCKVSTTSGCTECYNSRSKTNTKLAK